MKSKLIGSTLGMLSLILILFSCSKEKKDNVIAPVNNSVGHNLKQILGGGVTITVTFGAGHPASACNGQGLCFTYGWVFGPMVKAHVPCQGQGNNCTWTVGLGIIANIDVDEPVSYNLPCTIHDYSDPYFLMPDRSLWLPELGVYANIPHQALAATGNANEYLFRDLQFTTLPAYHND